MQRLCRFAHVTRKCFLYNGLSKIDSEPVVERYDCAAGFWCLAPNNRDNFANIGTSLNASAELRRNDLSLTLKDEITREQRSAPGQAEAIREGETSGASGAKNGASFRAVARLGEVRDPGTEQELTRAIMLASKG